jgi:hypothetical protein
MRVHAFLATPDALPRLLDAGTPPPTSAVLRGVDPVNLASLVEIVTAGSVDSEEAIATLENPVLTGGPRRPSIHLLPVNAADALGISDAAGRARWLAEWTGGNGRPDDAPEKTVEALAQLAAGRGPEQGVYLWVADGP